MVGDPRPSAERTLLTREQLEVNAEGIHQQLAHFLDFEPGPAQAIMANNLDWLGPMGFLEFLRDIGKHFPISYMLAKDSVQVRMEKGISFTEFSYMLLQAADFAHMYRTMGVEMQAGGADQWGNMTAGLELIRRTAGHGDGEEPAHAISYPLLLSPSGKKFGKSEGGDSIWLDPALTSPYRFYQYWIDVDDRDIGVYLRWFTLFGREEIEALDAGVAASPGGRAAQRALARDVTERAHGREAAERVIRVSEILFGGDPTGADEATLAALAAEIPAAPFPADGSVGVVDALIAAGAATSRGEARRLVEQGGVAVNGGPGARCERRRFGAEALLCGPVLSWFGRESATSASSSGAARRDERDREWWRPHPGDRGLHVFGEDRRAPPAPPPCVDRAPAAPPRPPGDRRPNRGRGRPLAIRRRLLLEGRQSTRPRSSSSPRTRGRT